MLLLPSGYVNYSWPLPNLMLLSISFFVGMSCDANDGVHIQQNQAQSQNLSVTSNCQWNWQPPFAARFVCLYVGTKSKLHHAADSLQQQTLISMSIWIISRPCAILSSCEEARQAVLRCMFSPQANYPPSNPIRQQTHVRRLKSLEINHNVLPPACRATFTLFNQFRNHQGTKLTYALPCDDFGYNVFGMDFSA